MARYYRRRRTIVRVPKKKWASNVTRFNKLEAFTSTGVVVVNLVTNSTQTSSPTPVIVKAGNFKIQGDAGVTVSTVSTAAAVPISVYVLYVPEGISVTTYAQVTGIIGAHPEWIIAWKYVSANVLTSTSAGADNSESFSFSSRLKRNLNSGDSIVLVAVIESGLTGNFLMSGMAQYWTCAN